MFCNSEKVETEKHFFLECEAFKDSKDSYVSILTTFPLHIKEKVKTTNAKFVKVQNVEISNYKSSQNAKCVVEILNC
jgi:hypothetical protein